MADKVANIVASVKLESQTSEQGSSGSPITLFTPSAAGLFRVSAYLEAASPQTGSVSLTVSYTNDFSQASTVVSIGCGPGANANAIAVLHAKASVAITYFTHFGVPGDTGNYNLYIVLESLD